MVRIQKNIRLTIDESVISQYEKHYFEVHTRATKKPIAHPYHESINVWMIMPRSQMNALKQKWKDFIVWFIENQGYANLHIEECELVFTAYYPTNRRHDVDNSVPKFILDGMVESGFLGDDDSTHVKKLSLQCFVDRDHPRTEIDVYYTE